MKASANVLMQKEDGSFLFALTEPSGTWSVEAAEVWIACIDLSKAYDLGLEKKMVLEGDCKNLFFYLSGDFLSWPLAIKGSLLDHKKLMPLFDDCSLSWVRRTAKKAVHVLAAMGSFFFLFLVLLSAYLA